MERATERKIQLELPACPCELANLRAATAKAALAAGFCQDKVDNITLAVTEAFTNIIRHGYKEKCQDEKVILTLEKLSEPDGIKITMRDFGNQVEPCQICGRDLDDIRPGGLGVHIMRSLMDLVEFKKADSVGMILTMIKYC
ncbi:MAG: ATP-binding protein [Sedimentisphaerales bacterium]|nr:ATP-binding protein [Sedimentisphaerales bacterium]MBN2841649.1 ATP-binding protein [Sedimentisphaerales bacterium]